MGPTIPDYCEFDTDIKTLPYTCLGCAMGTLDPATKLPFSGAPQCSRFHSGGKQNGDSCAGVFCRRNLPTALRTISDGLSNTFMAGETLPTHCVWNCVFCDNFTVSSTHIPLNTFEREDTAVNYWRTSGFKSEHPSGANLLTCDGSVHFVSETIDYVTYNVLGSRANDDTPPSNPF
jgi:prepilin-type processing-associated H-X9-DG protein